MTETTKILEANMSKMVYVKLKAGGYITGTLKAYDEELNLVLVDAQDAKQCVLGNVVLKGDCICSVEAMPMRQEWL